MRIRLWTKSATTTVYWATPLIVVWLAVLVTPTTFAQTSPAHGKIPAKAEMPMEDYLGLLRQIAPAAEAGARQYLAAIRLRCSRSLGSSELRLALSQASGDPQLLALIRANHLRDDHARERLVRQIQCPQGSKP